MRLIEYLVVVHLKQMNAERDSQADEARQKELVVVGDEMKTHTQQSLQPPENPRKQRKSEKKGVKGPILLCVVPPHSLFFALMLVSDSWDLQGQGRLRLDNQLQRLWVVLSNGFLLGASAMRRRSEVIGEPISLAGLDLSHKRCGKRGDRIPCCFCEV